MCEETIEEAVSFLARLSRGRVPCKSVQREAFQVLLTIRKRHPELVKDDVTKAAIAATMKEAPCKQK